MKRPMITTLVLSMAGFFCCWLIAAKVGAPARAAAAAAEEESPKPTSEADFRYAYLQLCAHLDGEKGMAGMKTIVNFSQQCPVTEVLISPDTAPWLAANPAPAYGEVLLAAYIAGNCLSQLDSGVQGSDAYSGAIQVLRVYRLLQKAHPEFRCKPIDELHEKHKKGTLISELAKLSKKPAKKK